MARPDERRKTQREQVNLKSDRPVTLEPNRRFLQAGGYSNNVRAARALEEAFGVGSKFVADEMGRRNAAGQTLAVTERGAGQDQDPDNTQAGYMRAWEQLNAETHYRLAEKELPELLRGFNSEERSEEEVGDFINQYLQSQYDGVQNLKDSAYAEYLAPRMLELETKHIGEHRDSVIAKVQEGQRTETYTNARDQLVGDRKAWAERLAASEEAGVPFDEPTPQLDYGTLFARTGTFFDGAMKKTVFWESIYDLAIEAGDSSIITNVPATLPSANGGSVPTGSEDILLRPEHRAAIKSADGVAARQASLADAANAAANKQAVFDTQLVIMQKANRGEDVSREIGMLRNNPEAAFSDVTASVNFGQAQIDEGDSRSMNLDFTATLWNAIYENNAGLSDIMEARRAGLLGSGPQAVKAMEDMMATVSQVKSAASRGDGSSVSTYAGMLRSTYNAQLDGILKGMDPAIHHIQTAALYEYHRLVLEDGMDPAKANRQVREEFDPLMSALSSNAASSSEFATDAGLISSQRAKAFAAGEIKVNTFARGHTRQTIEDSLHGMLMRDEITAAESERILLQLEN